MTLIEAMIALDKELEATGLKAKGWGSRLIDTRHLYGRCIYKERVIELSMAFIRAAPDSEVINTIKHECGHAIAGPDHGHDMQWALRTAELGAYPTRCSPVRIQPKWMVHCNACGNNMRGWNVRKDLSNRWCSKCRSKDIEYWPS